MPADDWPSRRLIPVELRHPGCDGPDAFANLPWPANLRQAQSFFDFEPLHWAQVAMGVTSPPWRRKYRDQWPTKRRSRGDQGVVFRCGSTSGLRYDPADSSRPVTPMDRSRVWRSNPTAAALVPFLRGVLSRGAASSARPGHIGKAGPQRPRARRCNRVRSDVWTTSSSCFRPMSCARRGRSCGHARVIYQTCIRAGLALGCRVAGCRLFSAALTRRKASVSLSFRTVVVQHQRGVGRAPDRSGAPAKLLMQALAAAIRQRHGWLSSIYRNSAE